jgi:hypothetical protein
MLMKKAGFLGCMGHYCFYCKQLGWTSMIVNTPALEECFLEKHQAIVSRMKGYIIQVMNQYRFANVDPRSRHVLAPT